METMKALVKFGPGKAGMEIRQIPKPQPLPDQLLLKILAVGICGTDIHIMDDEYPCTPPMVIGHEYVGEVVGMGEQVRGFALGDRIASPSAIIVCGTCRYCREGLRMMCPERESMGSKFMGPMAEYMVVPANLALKLPMDVPASDLAILEPFTCCLRAVVEQSLLRAGDIAVVSGPGTIGQLTAMVAKMQGAFVIMAGTPQDAQRLELAKQLGCDVTVSDPAKLTEVVHSFCKDGADVVYECAGAAASVANCLSAVRKRGNYVQVGLFGKPISFDMDLALMKELVINTTYATEPSSWDLCLRILTTKKPDFSPLISARYKLEDWSAAFDAVVRKEGFKTVLIP